MADNSGAKSGGTDSFGAKVTLEGDSSSLERAFTRSAQKAAEFDKSIQRVEASSKKANVAAQQQAAALEKSTATMGKHNAHAINTTKTVERVGFALHQVVGQTASFNTALQGVLSTLGPWGIAIGAAVAAVYHLVEAENAATKATQKHNEEMKKQQGLQREKEHDDVVAQLLARRARLAEKEAAKEEKDRAQIEVNHREEREFNEEQIVMATSRGESAEAFIRLQAESHEATLREQAAVSSFEKQQELNREADKVARDEKLRQLGAEGKHEKEITDHKKKQLTLAEQLAKINAEAMKRTPFGNDPSFGRTGESTLFDVEAAANRPTGIRGSQLGQTSPILRDPNAVANAQKKQNAALREVELERASQRQFDLDSELARIDREQQAQLDFATFKEEIAANDEQRAALVEEQEQIRHEGRLQRIAAESQAEEERQAKIQKWTAAGAQAATQTVMGILSITDARRAAVQAAKAQGKTDAEAAQAGKKAAREALAAQLTSLRNLAITKAIEQTALGIGALATTWGIPNPSAALHFAAAATWGVVAGGAGLAARAASSSAAGMGGGAGSGGGSQAGGGSQGQGGANLPPGSNSPIPGSPGPNAPSAGGGQGQSGGGNVMLDLRGAHFYGTGGPKEFMRQIDEGLQDLSHNRKPRRAS